MSAQTLEVRMARVEGALEQVDKRIGELSATMDSRFTQVDLRFAQVDSRLAQVDGRFDDLGREIRGLQWRMTSLIVGTAMATIATVILHH